MNREQRRKWAKIRKKSKVLNTGPFCEGTKVVLNYNKLVFHNPKRNRWCEEHKDDVLTIEKDEKFNNAYIYTLKEDTTDPKWLFSNNDLLTVEEYLRAVNQKEKINDTERSN